METKSRNKYLQEAYERFRECEALLPPGVETLTNLETVLLQLSRTTEARDYAQRAIALNPDYEYAYYRLAQCWENDGNADEVLKTLRTFAQLKTPGIPSFRALYEKHAVELARH